MTTKIVPSADCPDQADALALLPASKKRPIRRWQYARFVNEDTGKSKRVLLHAHHQIRAEIHQRLEQESRGRQKHEATRVNYQIAPKLANKANSSSNHVQLTAEKKATSHLDAANAD